MKTLITATGSYLTGSRIADAVMRHGLALSRRHDVGLVELPFIDADGVVRRVSIMSGWQVGVASVSHADSGPELVDDAAVSIIESRAASPVSLVAHPFSADEVQLANWPRFDQEYMS